jgi:hypothetical protein
MIPTRWRLGSELEHGRLVKGIVWGQEGAQDGDKDNEAHEN